MIELKIDAHQMRIPGVAQALAGLVHALGGGTPTPLPGVWQVAGRPEVLQGIGVGNLDGIEKVELDKVKKGKPDLPEPSSGSFEEFRKTLTPHTCRVLDILEGAEGGVSTMHLAEELGVALKGVGGVVGAMQRKAARRGVEIPIEKVMMDDGQRCWRWVG